MYLELEHGIVQVGCSSVVLEHLRYIAGVADTKAQAAGELVANAANIANYGFVECIGAGAGVIAAQVFAAAVLGEAALVQDEATLGTKFQKQALAVFAQGVFEQNRHVDVAQGVLIGAIGFHRGARQVGSAVLRSAFLRIEQFTLHGNVVGEAIVEHTTGCEASLILRAFRIGTRERRTVEAAFEAEFQAGLSIGGTRNACKQCQG